MKKVVAVLCLSATLQALAQDAPAPLKMTVEQYIEKHSPIAVEEMYRSNIPASITLAQGILESGNGNSRLALEANNHFGIKCKAGWTGKSIYEDDDAPQECFRKYDAVIDSYRDHSEFLMKNTRYAFLFDLDRKDYKSWAHGLKKAGYATNPQYPDLLITFIEKHNLQRYDEMPLSEEEKKELSAEKAGDQQAQAKVMINNVPGIVARADDSYTQIALDNDLKVWQLYKFNDLEKDAKCKAGDTVYLKAKKGKGDQELYKVAGTETMYWISQRFAVKLEKLMDKNLMTAGQEPATGEIIHLQKKRETLPVLRSQVIKAEVLTLHIDTLRMDTPRHNETVYENAAKNIATMMPVENAPLAYFDTLQEFKESLSFFHTVQAGETLYGIAKKYKVRVDAIRFINNLASNDIKTGTRLIINPNIPSADTKDPQPVPGLHEVREGETLNSIAATYNIKTEEIKALNNLAGETIHIGQKLVIVPVKNDAAPAQISEHSGKASNVHEVEKGETLYAISRKYNVPVNELKSLNPDLGDTLLAGQKLKIR